MADDDGPRRAVSEQEQRRAIASTRRFDLRRILGGLFLVYGVIVTTIGIVHNGSDVARAGMPINLYAGIGMLVLGVLFLVWDRLAPVPEADVVASLQGEESAEASERQADGSVS